MSNNQNAEAPAGSLARTGSAAISCPHCGAGLLWSEDRGAHCDGCDEFDPETDLPKRKAERRRGERRRTTLKRNPGVLSSAGLAERL